MKNISFDKNILYIGDKNIVFEDEIFQVKIEDDKIYVLLDIKPKEKLTYDDCNNVFCYSGKGRKIWQIGVRPKGNPTVYTMINFDDKYLYANDFMGRRYYIDKNTGEIQGMGLHYRIPLMESHYVLLDHERRMLLYLILP